MPRLWTLIKCKWKWSVYQVGCVYYVILLISQLLSTVTKLQRHQVAVLWKVPIHKKKIALFRVIRQRILVIYYRRFGTNSWSLLRGPRTGLCWIIDLWRWDLYVVQERRKNDHYIHIITQKSSVLSCLAAEIWSDAYLYIISAVYLI
jgi:hypothetical protein